MAAQSDTIYYQNITIQTGFDPYRNAIILRQPKGSQQQLITAIDTDYRRQITPSLNKRFPGFDIYQYLDLANSAWKTSTDNLIASGAKQCPTVHWLSFDLDAQTVARALDLLRGSSEPVPLDHIRRDTLKQFFINQVPILTPLSSNNAKVAYANLLNDQQPSGFAILTDNRISDLVLFDKQPHSWSIRLLAANKVAISFATLVRLAVESRCYQISIALDDDQLGQSLTHSFRPSNSHHFSCFAL